MTARVFARDPDGNETEITRACGFERIDEVERYLNEQHASDEQREFLRKHKEAYEFVLPDYTPPPHDHVFSSAGRCMWAYCKETTS